MATEYLGSTIVDPETVPAFAGYTPTDWAILFIEMYGQIDGEHHKAWVLDQVTRILKGTSVVVKLARWSNGEEEYRFHTNDIPSPEYLAWVEEMLGDEVDGEREYDYYKGIAP